MATIIQKRYDTAANWATVNTVLAIAEEGYESDTGKHKIGDGVTAWNDLAYYIGTIVPENAVFTDATYASGDFDHDSLSGVTANEHIDWTVDNVVSDVHADNIPDLSSTYLTTETSHGTITLGTDAITNTTLDTDLDIAGNGTGVANIDGNAATSTTASGVSTNSIDATALDVVDNGLDTQFLKSDGLGGFTWDVPTDTNTEYLTGTDTVAGILLLGATGGAEAYDAANAKTDVAQTFTASQRGTITEEDTLSIDLALGNNISVSGSGELTFVNLTSGQSGNIILTSTGTITKTALVKADTDLLTTVSTAGTYWISYITDGTSVYISTSQGLA